MKKSIALLLTFIMVFTMIPSIIGPAALAYDGTNCPEICANSILTEFPSSEWDIKLHDDFYDENGQLIHKIVGQHKTERKVKMFTYNSAGELDDSLAIDADGIEIKPVLRDSKEIGHTVMIKYADPDTYWAGYAEYNNIYLAIGTDSDYNRLLDACQKVVNAREDDVEQLQKFVDDDFNHITIPHYNYIGLEAFDPIVYYPGGWNIAPAKIYTKTQVNRFTAKPLIEYIGIGKVIDYEFDTLGLFVSICDALMTLNVVGVIETLSLSFIEYITAPSYWEPEYTVYFDYFFSYGKLKEPLNLEVNHDLNGLPESQLYTWSYPDALGRSDWAKFIRDPRVSVYEASGWRCIRRPVLNDPGITSPEDQQQFLMQLLIEKHWHTYQPDDPNGLGRCSTICPVCGFGRRSWPSNIIGESIYGDKKCWRHVKNEAGQWEHIRIDVNCDIPIPNWYDEYTRYEILRFDCDCTDPEERYANEPNHIYSDCTDKTCNECGFVRNVGNHHLNDCWDDHCDYCLAPHTPQDHVMEWRETALYDEHGFPLFDENGSPLKGHLQGCKNCEYIDLGSMGQHSYGDWTPVDNDDDGDKDDYELGTCQICHIGTTTRAHDLVECGFYTQDYHAPITALEVCQNGGSVRHGCWNGCGYSDPFYTDVDSGHINPDGDCICDRCGTPAFHQLKYNQLYEANGVPKTIHEVYCEKCPYKESVPHSYGAWSYDNENTCTRQCSECNISDTQSHLHDVWNSISDTLEESTCSRCNSPDTSITRPHVYLDETDRYCNNGCGRDRLTATDHNYVWCGYDDRGVALSYHFQRCESCGYFNPEIQEDHSYGAWTYDNANTCTRQCSKCNLSDTASHVHDVWHTISDTQEESTCSHCNSPSSRITRPHVFSDETDRYCGNTGCNYDRYTATNHQYEWCGYDSRGIALTYHYQRCESCGYNYPGQEDHSYGAWTYDNANTCTRRCLKCNVSDTASHVHDVWRTISDTLEESSCSHCNSPNTTITRPHVFSDETDRYCNNIGCNYDRYTATNHQYAWCGYDDRGYALTYHYKRCASCGYNNPDTEPHAYSYTNVDSDTCRGKCSKCGLSTDFNHSYTNCADRYCNNNCGHDRGLSGVAGADGHVYTNCGDLTCNRAGCSFVRAAASADHQLNWCKLYDANGFELTEHDKHCEVCGYVVPGSREAHTYNYTYISDAACRKTCSKCGSNTDVPHVYSDCKDTICYRCDHTSRASVSGILYSDDHVYTSCSDTLCNRTGCGHTRTAVSHAYNSWQSISSSQHRRACTICSATQDGNHYYSNCGDASCNASCGRNRGAAPSGSILYSDGHVYYSCTDTTCNRSGCGHTRTAVSHTYPSTWKYYSANTHRHACTRCGSYYYQYHNWVNVTAGLFRCSGCGATKYGS